MNIDNSFGNGSFSEAKLLVGGVTYYGLEDLLRRFDEEVFSKEYGVIDKKTNKKINPKLLIWAWIQKELQNEFDATAEHFDLTNEQLQESLEKHHGS